MDGDYFARFIHKNFWKLFQKSGTRNSKLFIPDNCPVQNCVEALSVVGAQLFAIPRRWPELNAIENVFNLAKHELKNQALRENITFESYEQLSERVKCTLYEMKSDVIDKIISTMYKRLQLIVKHKGMRTKY